MSGLPAGALPLDNQQTNNLQAAVSGLSAQQLQWVSGYVAGLAAAGTLLPTQVEPASAANSDSRLTVLFGSQTGNGEAIAASLAEQARAQGFAVQLTSLADYKPSSLKRESLVTFVISTHGEGDPPDDAELFYEFLMSDKAPQLEGVEYSVLALGDSSYVNYCQTGRDFDSRLAELGAKRFEAVVECDLDYEDAAATWTERVLAELPTLLQPASASEVVPMLRAVESVSAFDKNNPFSAEVIANQKITGGASSKDVRHIELSLEGSGIHYEPGDSLAVLAENPPQLVDELLAQLDLQADASVAVRGEAMLLIDALSSELEITATNLGFLREWAVLADAVPLRDLLLPDAVTELSQFVDTHQIIDVVREFPASVDAQQLVDLLRRLSPRSYSIASSQQANPDEVHLTVAAVRYDAFGRKHWGAASTHLADRLEQGDTVRVYVEKNTRFRLPQPTTPIVMIGPGTGIAPFRSFVEERVEQGATGPSWLFFGDRNFDTDFLYQLEWQRYLKQGHLQRLDVAFSRDQRQKIYVQDRIREQGAELKRWLDDGAALYVCGDAKHMAGDVHEALLDVLVEHAGLERNAAEMRLKELRSAGRYQRDVY